MRKYYLFLLRNEPRELYKKNSTVLFHTLNNLYQLKLEDCRIGVSIYNQICDVFNKDLIINYLKEKYNLSDYKDKYLLENKKEKILIKINRSCVILYTTSNVPFILKILYLYSKNIFVVDFKNEDYFWLGRQTLQ